MVNKILAKGRSLIIDPQNSLFSAASTVMLMIMVSRVLGLVRQRVLANFFPPSDLSLFFAAFRLPDLIFEVLVFGTFSSAFIPVFTRALKEGGKVAWDIAARVVNIGLVLFSIAALLFSVFTKEIYTVVAPGYSTSEIAVIASIARLLFIAQGFFVISYVLTGVLESLKRFLVPALAPVFYNTGIILGTVFFAGRFGLMAPAIGVVIGAFLHFLIQLPLAFKLGFRFSTDFVPNSGVKKIGKLATPRIVDLSFDQIGKTVELSLASIISKASYTYFTFANTLQLLPVSLFGTSLAKAALPSLSSKSDEPDEFRKILVTTIFQAIFLTAPVAAGLIILRIPVIRLVYGTNIFDWSATVRTSEVLSAFALGVVFQTLVAILGRAFFALHDTKTPVVVSLIGLSLLVIGDFILVLGFNLPVWALALSFSFGYFVETVLLLVLMNQRIGKIFEKKLIIRALKLIVATALSSSVMFFLLKILDKSVWVKGLSLVGKIQGSRDIPFEKFVIDTHYTINVILLCGIVIFFGVASYIVVLFLLKSDEIWTFILVVRRILKERVFKIHPKEPEPVTPVSSDTTA